MAGDPVADERIILETVKAALDLGVDVNAADKDGNTALHTAATKRLDTVIQSLAEKGANLEAKNKKGQTALALASGGGTGGGNNSPEGNTTPAAGDATASLLRKLGAKDN